MFCQGIDHEMGVNRPQLIVLQQCQNHVDFEKLFQHLIQTPAPSARGRVNCIALLVNNIIHPFNIWK